MEEKPYNAGQFFDSWYSSALNAGGFSDRITLSTNYTNLMVDNLHNFVYCGKTNRNEDVLVNKRMRSLKYWIKTAAKYNLYPVDFMRNNRN